MTQDLLRIPITPLQIPKMFLKMSKNVLDIPIAFPNILIPFPHIETHFPSIRTDSVYSFTSSVAQHCNKAAGGYALEGMRRQKQARAFRRHFLFTFGYAPGMRRPSKMLSPFQRNMGPSWGSLGAILGRSWGHLGALLGPYLGCICACTFEQQL